MRFNTRNNPCLVLTCRINGVHGIMTTVIEHICIEGLRSCTSVGICINESIESRPIVPAPEIIQPRLFIVDIAAVTERLHSAERADKSTSLTDGASPGVIHIPNNNRTIGIKDSNHITLQVLHVAVRHTVIHHNSRLVACIIEEMQFIISAGKMHNVLAMQRIVGHNAIHGFLHPQPVFVVYEAGRGFAVCHAGKLPAILPGVSPLTIVQRVADLVVGNAHTINSSELVAPVGGTMSIRRYNMELLLAAQKVHPAMPDGQWVGRGSGGLVVQPARHVIEVIVDISNAATTCAEMF